MYCFSLNYYPDLTFNLQSTVFTSIKEAFYPAEVCVDFDQTRSQWIQYLTYDRAYFYTCLFTSQGIVDYSRDAKIGATTLAYHSKSLQHLRLNLAESKTATSTSTLAVVVSLVLISAQFGDIDMAKNHMHALYEMVKMRGGIESLRENYELQIKVCR